VLHPRNDDIILMKNIGNEIAANHAETYMIMLLIEERPEDVTDMERICNAEVNASYI
jgi:Transcription termination factor